MKNIIRKHALLSLLILNAPAWSLDHSIMDMNSMSDMDMSMPMHEKHQTHAKPSIKTLQAKTRPHHEEQPAIMVKKTLPIETKTPTMDMSKMNHAAPAPSMDHMDHHSIDPMPMTMHMGNMQGGAAPAQARSSDYSQGRNFGPIHPPMMMGNDPLMSLAINRLEWAHSGNQNQATYELEGWWGDDWNRAVLKAEGEINSDGVTDARTELLWRKPFDTFWNTEFGVRQDSGYVNNHTWLALGINGIAPYWLDLDATFYVRDQRQTALILNVDYDWRITQSWVLQPRLEMSFYGENDVTNDRGQGLSEVQSGLRLRYDRDHQFAPYVGVEINRHYGKTAELLNVKGEQTNQAFAVAGVAFWF